MMFFNLWGSLRCLGNTTWLTSAGITRSERAEIQLLRTGYLSPSKAHMEFGISARRSNRLRKARSTVAVCSDRAHAPRHRHKTWLFLRIRFTIWARWHKILEFVPSCPICGWLAWRCDFFPVGQPLKIIPQVFSQKRSSPLDSIFDTCASASWSHLFWLVKLNICGCTPFARTNVFSAKKNACFAIRARWHKILEFVPSCPICGWLAWRCDFFPVGPTFEDYPASIQSKKVQPLGFYFWPLRLGLLKSFFWLVKVNVCVCTLLQSHVKNHTPSINHGTFFSWGLTFRYVLVNSHLIHPPSNSWLLTLGILQTYPLSESFMIDFLMPYIHRLIDQPPLNHNRQKLISCHCTSGSFQEKKSGPFLVWYFIPGPISCPGTLTHCLLDFWKIVFF